MSSRSSRPSHSLDIALESAASRRRLLQGSAALAGAAAMSRVANPFAANAQEPTKGGTLVVGFQADPETLDPHITTALVATRVFSLFHDNLVTSGFDGSIQPGLADTWEISDDGLTYTFHLKQGVTFHSGKAFTSADVVYTYERWRGNEASPTAYNIDAIDTITAPDDFTVVFTLKQPNNVLINAIAGSYGVILNQESVEAAGDQYGVSVVDGTGPYKFVSWERTQSIKMERFDDYTWGSPAFSNPGPAYLDGIEIHIIPEDATRVAEFQAGNLTMLMDVPPADVERLTDQGDYTVVTYAQLQTTYLGFNQKQPITSDIAVRQAVNYVIDRDEIVEGAYFGLGDPAFTMLNPNTKYFDKSTLDIAPTFDVDKANQLLDDAGWTLNGDVREKDGTQLTIPFWVTNDSATVLMAQIVEEQLADVGIKVETTQYEQTAWFEAARSGNQTMYSIGVFYDSADVLYFNFYSGQQPAPNRFGYAEPDVDALLEDTRSNPDLDTVAEDYKTLQTRIITDAVIAPIMHAQGTLGVASSVQGVQVHPSRWMYRMLDVSLAG